MNPHTGHLVATVSTQLLQAGYLALPEELNRSAALKLNGKSEAYVSLKSGGRLADWAKKKRKAKISAQSKRKNR